MPLHRAKLIPFFYFSLTLYFLSTIFAKLCNEYSTIAAMVGDEQFDSSLISIIFVRWDKFVAIYIPAYANPRTVRGYAMNKQQ